MGVRGKKFVPTEEQRAAVQEAVGLGGTQAVIAKMLGISVVTLEKAFRRELDTGAEIACQRVARSLYERAIDPKTGMAGVSAGIFFLKARGNGNWRDDYRTVEHVGADGKPLPPQGGVMIVLPDNGRDPHLHPPQTLRTLDSDGKLAPARRPKLIEVAPIDTPCVGVSESR